MKDIKLKLISELMKNSRRSDRDLAKIIGVSQPTITRTRIKLEKEGYIQEYTIIPNFKKLGFQIMTIALTKMKRKLDRNLNEEVRRKTRENQKKHPSPALLVMNGLGVDSDRVLIVLSEDYSTYSKYLQMIREFPTIEMEQIKSFMIDLKDESSFMPLTFSSLAEYLGKEQSKA